MKRLWAAFLVLVCLLLGCGKEIDYLVPNESKTVESCILVRELTTERDFGSFAAGPCTDASRARELVHEALSMYPPGFAEQWGGVQILLCSGLTGAADFAGGHWAGFTQRQGEGWLLVLDADACDVGTVHHEIAHILDGLLTEAGALDEGAWMELCPVDFAYGQTGQALYADFFPDEYAMENIREDRARTFEDAMRYGPGVYADRPALWLKLEYFSRAIRGHFDTGGWPEKTVWELALG